MNQRTFSKILFALCFFLVLVNFVFATGETEVSRDLSTRLAFFAVIFPAAIGDSINPCAFAVMFILLSSILKQHQSRKKVLLAGFMFTFAIFISYLAIGKGLYSALASTNNTNMLKVGAGILGILVGLGNLKDYFWYGKYFRMEVPTSWRPKMKKIIKKITSPIGAFFIGFIISLFLLPCTAGPYIAILGYLSGKTDVPIIWANIYLIVYNLIFIIPMIAIAFIVAFGVKDVGTLKEYKEMNVEKIHLITGVIMLLLGCYILYDVGKFYV